MICTLPMKLFFLYLWSSECFEHLNTCREVLITLLNCSHTSSTLILLTDWVKNKRRRETEREREREHTISRRQLINKLFLLPHSLFLTSSSSPTPTPIPLPYISLLTFSFSSTRTYTSYTHIHTYTHTHLHTNTHTHTHTHRRMQHTSRVLLTCMKLFSSTWRTVSPQGTKRKPILRYRASRPIISMSLNKV